MHAGCREIDREVGKRSIESIQKLSDHAVDGFLVSPGLRLRGLELRPTGGFFLFLFFFAFF